MSPLYIYGSRAETVPPVYPKIASALPHTSGGAAILTPIKKFYLSIAFLSALALVAAPGSTSLSITLSVCQHLATQSSKASSTVAKANLYNRQ
jgi:hypothetical protein